MGVDLGLGTIACLRKLCRKTANKRKCTITSRQVVFFNVVGALVYGKITQGVQQGRLPFVTLTDPDLVTTKQFLIKNGCFVGAENKLCSSSSAV